MNYYYLFVFVDKKNFTAIIKEPQGIYWNNNNNNKFMFCKTKAHNAINYPYPLSNVSQLCSWSTPNTADFVCILNQTHLLQLIGSLAEMLKWPGKPSPSNSDVPKWIGRMNDSVTRSLDSLFNESVFEREYTNTDESDLRQVFFFLLVYWDKIVITVWSWKQILPFVVINLLINSITFLRQASMLLPGRWENQETSKMVK